MQGAKRQSLGCNSLRQKKKKKERVLRNDVSPLCLLPFLLCFKTSSSKGIITLHATVGQTGVRPNIQEAPTPPLIPPTANTAASLGWNSVIILGFFSCPCTIRIKIIRTKRKKKKQTTKRKLKIVPLLFLFLSFLLHLHRGSG